MSLERTYLYVPPEDYPDVQASGAHWDDDSKRWYVPSNVASAEYSRWLEGLGDPEFNIVVEKAFVASARVSCQRCAADIEVVCIYGDIGTDLETDQPLEQFSVSSMWNVDANLAQQLKRWPNFRTGGGEDDQSMFVNHCAQCAEAQEEYLLHEEPGDVFFGLSRENPGELEYTPLIGRMELSGDLSFRI